MSLLNHSVFCLIRKKWVSALPEEKVRQRLVREMVEELGYPIGAIALEKSLSELPHLSTVRSLPKRRADLIVFSKDLHLSHPFYPLLLVECKAVSLTPKVLRQVVGYNQFVGACFIGVVSPSTSVFGWFEPNQPELSFFDTLPRYESLLSLAKSRACHQLINGIS